MVIYFKIFITSSLLLQTAFAAASTSFRAWSKSLACKVMIFLFKPIAYPASKAAFHCLYFSPNFIITMSDFLIHILLLIELIDAPL